MHRSTYSIDKNRFSLPRRIVALVAAFVFFGIVGIIGVRVYYQQNLKPVGGAGDAVIFTVEDGATVKEIAGLLKQQELIRSSAAFSWYVSSKEAGSKIQAGTYELQATMGVPEIVALLTKGAIMTDLVTILPAQRLSQIRESLINNGFSEASVDAALEPMQYEGNPALVDKPAGASLEGYLYPETFQRTKSTDPKEIILLSLQEMQNRLTPDLRAAFAKQGLSTFQAVTLASIVGKEASCGSQPEVCRKITQVFLNRLAIDMMLGSDVTACYGALVAGAMKVGDNCNDFVRYDSAYNTRLYKGFTPGPISNVNQAALESVANPTSGDWLYFVAGDDGNTYFSRTLAEHEANVAAHCIELCN